MGENFAEAGFAGVEAMVAAMSSSEDQQLGAMANFLIANKLHLSLRSHDWATFARGYNGPNYAINRYDVRLNAEYQKWSAGILPDLNVRATQLYLTYLGFHPGPIDGVAGERTLAALADFQQKNGVEASASISVECVAGLQSALELNV
jgi:lysozyme family protein